MNDLTQKDVEAAGVENEAISRLRRLERELDDLRREMGERRRLGVSIPDFPLKALLFEVEGTRFAINVRVIVEVTNMVFATSIPGTPSCIRGAVNRRGKVVPIVDLSLALGEAPGVLDEDVFLIFVKTVDRIMAIPADRLVEVKEFTREDVDDGASNGSMARFVSCVIRSDTKIINLLDPTGLLRSGELDELVGALLKREDSNDAATPE